MNGVINYQNYYNMELMFNELSVEPLSKNKYMGIEKAKEFALTMGDARKKGFKRIRSHKSNSEILLSQDYSLKNYLNDKSLPNIHRTHKGFLYGTIILPFINDDDVEVSDNYIMSNFHFDNNEKKQDCLGLTAAFFYDTLSISLNSSPLWKNNTLLIINEVEEVAKTEQVNNVFSKDCFDVQSISDFVEYLGDVVLDETPIKPEDKKIHLADHHGKKELNKLCNKLINSNYVIEMRSTNWGGKDFIRKVTKEGVIEIVLINSQREYALRVQTTGRNYRETEAIAQNLRERYS